MRSATPSAPPLALRAGRLLVLAALAVPAVHGQSTPLERLRRAAEADGFTFRAERVGPFPAGSACELRVDRSGVPPALNRAPERVAGKTQAATFSVTYTGFTADFQAAIQRAVDTWAGLLTSPIPIRVEALFVAKANPNVLASAGPVFLWQLRSGATPCGQPGATCFIAGDALADKLVGSDLNPGGADIQIEVNSNFTNWYTGTGIAPADQFDVESVVLHELGHGLNFIALASYDAATQQGTSTVSGTGTSGIYDQVLFDAPTAGNLLVDMIVYPSPSVALGNLLKGNGLYFGDARTDANNGGARARIYAPATYNAGSSISHLDEATFNGTQSALMTFAFAPGELARTPGTVACGIMQDMLWTVDQSTCAAQRLPVEMVAFDAATSGPDVVLRWTTAGETNNAGFDIERRAGAAGSPFARVGYEPGQGTSARSHTYEHVLSGLAPGRHAFRLRQVDTDGRFAYTPEVEAVVEVAGTHALSALAPNPFSGVARFTLAVREAQAVRVEAFDALGRRVAVLHDGPLDAGDAHALAFDGAGLPAGLYVVRAVGERFHATRTVTLLR